jgi:hypothetical protein
MVTTETDLIPNDEWVTINDESSTSYFTASNESLVSKTEYDLTPNDEFTSGMYEIIFSSRYN